MLREQLRLGKKIPPGASLTRACASCFWRCSDLYGGLFAGFFKAIGRPLCEEEAASDGEGADKKMAEKEAVQESQQVQEEQKEEVQTDNAQGDSALANQSVLRM